MQTKETSSSCKLTSWNSPDGAFTKTILEPGIGVDKPKECSICRVFVDLISMPHVQSCPEVDLSYPIRCWFEAELGEGETSQDCLIDQCLETMLSGEVCQINTAMGSKFLLRLENFEHGKETWELDTDEKIQRATRDKEKGGKAYREGNIDGAERRYSRALRLLVCTPGEAEAERVTLLTNMAACDLKKGRLRKAEERCTRALEKEPQHIKALYRRGVARAGMSDWKGARGDFEELLRLDPGNKEARKELGRVREGEKKEHAQIGKALGKMFL
ncbi:FK506-binding protein-like [Rhinophrynus dorsalis]